MSDHDNNLLRISDDEWAFLEKHARPEDKLVGDKVPEMLGVLTFADALHARKLVGSVERQIEEMEKHRDCCAIFDPRILHFLKELHFYLVDMSETMGYALIHGIDRFSAAGPPLPPTP